MTELIQLAWIPLVGAFVGYITNVLAIRMLFRPRRPVRVLGVTFQGLVPRRRRELSEAIGRTVAEHLVTHEDILEVLTSDEVQQGFTQTIEERIGRYLRERVVRGNAVLGKVMNERVIAGLQRALAREVMRVLPRLLDLFQEPFQRHVDIRAIVVERLEQFEQEKIEAIIVEVADRELKAIEVLGGVLGLIIGLVQFLIVALILY